VGLRGRGGHGHNDALSFDLVLDGRDIIIDSGCFVYTSSREMRKQYVSAFAHNVATIDDMEPAPINEQRFIHATFMETKVSEWDVGADMDCFGGEHHGYEKLAQPVVYKRGICLLKHPERVLIEDTFQGIGEHHVAIRFHFAPGWQLERNGQRIHLRHNDDAVLDYYLTWSEPGMEFRCEESYYSPSYGIKISRLSAVFSSSRKLPFECVFEINKS